MGDIITKRLKYAALVSGLMVDDKRNILWGRWHLDLCYTVM